ncbi:hypothetical protein Tco_1332032, partial [Tanacetum coccineum]
SSDEESTLANDRSSKADRYKAVPSPIIGKFLIPRADISFAGLDEYVIRNKIIESQTTELNTKISETAEIVLSLRVRTQMMRNKGMKCKQLDLRLKQPSISTARPVYASRSIYPRMDKMSYYTKPAFRPKDLKQDVKTFGVKNMTTTGKRAVVNTDNGSFMLKKGNPEILLQDHVVVDSGCSSHMTGNKAYLSDYEDSNEGFVAFGSDPKEV